MILDERAALFCISVDIAVSHGVVVLYCIQSLSSSTVSWKDARVHLFFGSCLYAKDTLLVSSGLSRFTL